MTDNVTTTKALKPTQYINTDSWDIFAVLKESWQLVKGVRLTYVTAAFIYFMTSLLVQTVIDQLLPVKQPLADLLMSGLHGFANTASTILLTPLMIGYCLLGVERSKGKAISIRQLFNYFTPKILKRVFKAFLWALLIFSPVLLVIFGSVAALSVYKHMHPWLMKALFVSSAAAILIGIYLWGSYIFSPLLIADKDLLAGDSFTVSRKGFNKHWLQFSGVMFFVFLPLLLIVGVAIFLPATLMIAALIFGALFFVFALIPWGSIAFGMVYQKMFKDPALRFGE